MLTLVNVEPAGSRFDLPALDRPRHLAELTQGLLLGVEWDFSAPLHDDYLGRVEVGMAHWIILPLHRADRVDR